MTLLRQLFTTTMTVAVSLTGMALAISAALSTALTPTPASAQGAADYPNRPITLIVPYAAGVTADLLFRGLGEIASKHLGQPIVVDNRAGGSGTLGVAQMVATGKLDGYTVCQSALPMFRVPLMQKSTFDALKDFTYIIVVANYQVGAVVNAEGEFKTWADIIAFAKANPGKLNYSTLGPATTLNMAIELISREVGIQMTHVPSKGGGESVASLLGNHVHMIVESPSWAPMVSAGKLRLLMVLGSQREQQWPNVPSMKDLGYSNFFDSPTGLVGPKGMDPAIVKKLHDAFKLAMDDPKVTELYQRLLFGRNYMDSAAFTTLSTKLVDAEREMLGKLGLLKKD